MRKFITKNYIKSQYPELYEKIMMLDWGESFKEKLFIVQNNIHCPPKCPICGKDVNFDKQHNKYRTYCSPGCVSKGTREAARTSILSRGGWEAIYEKSCETRLARYGDPHYNNMSKHINTCMERYGAGSSGGNKERIQKMKETFVKKYGENWPNIFHKKSENTLFGKYGVKNPMQCPDISSKVQNTKRNIFLLKNKGNIIGYDENGNWICECIHNDCTLCEEKTFSIKPQLYRDRLHNNIDLCPKRNPLNPSTSSLEINVRGVLDGLQLEYIKNTYSILSNLELDIYIPSLALAIECNGSYWHSLYKKPPLYHYKKWYKCKEQNIELISVWGDWEMADIGAFIIDKLEGGDLNKYKELWFPDVQGWPLDLGWPGVLGAWREHMCTHDGMECMDSGLSV